MLISNLSKAENENFAQAWAATTALAKMINTIQTATATLTRYTNALLIPFLIATSYFSRVERQRFWTRTPLENMMAYMKLGTMNLDMMNRALKGGLQATDDFLKMEMEHLTPALAGGNVQALMDFSGRLNHLVDQVAYIYPEAIDLIASEFGFHFERQPPECKVDETDRFLLYQVLPTEPKVETRKDGKPILIVPPFVLGANILSFLPAEKRSYAHAFANQGIPTYIRVLKDIKQNDSVQTMAPEDDTRDTQRFCRIIQQRHGSPVTLNGYCQGGYQALCNLLSGELDGLVDAFISCVAPMDGTCSKGLASFLEQLPNTFNDLEYGTKLLPNGNKVADGQLMGWIYKLKSIESETPFLAMWRDMMFVGRTNGDPTSISKTAAALNYWLVNERNDLPLSITNVSFLSYNIPISSEGILPVKLFGRELGIKRLRERKTPWLICYGKQDDLVEPETALAPLNWIDAEVTGFPKGHVAIATSWSHPESAYALHQRYPKDSTRGPVRFQLDLQEALDAARRIAAVPVKKESRKAASKGKIQEIGKTSPTAGTASNKGEES